MKTILWLAALLAIGAIAVCAQLDRQARAVAAIAPQVPAPFRAFAHERLAFAALAQGDTVKAMAAGRDLLRVRPLPAENLRLFGQAAILAGDAQAGSKAMTLAGQRGWRDPFTQLVMTAAAIDSGNLEVASQRLFALHSTGQQNEQSAALMIRLVQSPQGREAMATRAVGEPEWAETLIGLNPARIGVQNYADLLQRAERHGAAIPCEKLQLALRKIHRAGLADRDAAILGQRCAG